MASIQVLVIACTCSALVGGAVSGFVVNRLGAEREAVEVEAEPKKKKKVATPRVDTQLETRLAELEGQLASLRRSQQAREALTKFAESMTDDESDAPKQKKPSGVVDEADPVFELAVRSVMDRVEWEKDEEEKAVRQQRRTERASRQTALLTERLKLSEEQAQEVSAVLTSQMDRFRGLRDRDGESGDSRPATRSEWRERIETIRKETEQELAKVLSEEQMAAYQSYAEEEGIGGRGFGRRRGTQDERGTRQASD